MNNTPASLLLIVDHDRRFRDAQEAGQRLSPSDEAEKIALMASAFAANMKRVAFVSEHDPEGLHAFLNAGYETIQVNGNREQVLSARIGNWRQMLTEGNPLNHLVVVSPDRQFEPLILKAKQSDGAVHVWAAGESTPRELKRPFYNFRDLNDMFPNKSEIIVYLDYENLHITLERNGFETDPQKLMSAIKTMAADFGTILSFEAYADWGELERHGRTAIQRQLAELEVNTHYLISRHGKNSADMRIVKDVRDALELLTSRHNLQKIVLVSGDSDFRDLVFTIREHGKGAVVLGLKDSMSASLAKAACEVRYLDNLLCSPAQDSQVPDVVPTPWSAQVRLLARISKVLCDHQTEEMEMQVLLREAKIDARQLTQGLAQKLLVINEKHENGSALQAISLNRQHHWVAALEYLAGWVPARIMHALSRGLPWVDSNYLARGMRLDAQLQAWKIGQDRREADGWLVVVESMGLTVKQLRAHPNTPEHQVSTWVLPEQKQCP